MKLGEERYRGIFVALVAILVYANAVANGFVLDDGGVLRGNPLVERADGIWRAFAHSYWPEPLPGGQYRPLGIASFALDWALTGGDPGWMHAVNILWHAAASVMVWLLAVRLLSPMGALPAALAFAVHPVHVEAVANVVGRLEPMAATFAIGALIAHRRRSWWAPPLFALGLLSKESAIVFVGLAVASDLLLPRAKEPNEENERRESEVAPTALRSQRVRLYLAYAAIIVVYAIVLAVIFRGRGFSIVAPTWIGTSTAERLLTVATIVPNYVRLLLFPLDLSADYYPQVIPLVSGVTPAALLGLALALVLGEVVRRAWRSAPELAFSLLWVPIVLAPVSNVFFPSGVSLAERTLYLPSVGACLALGWAMQHAAARARRPALALAAVALLLGVARTWARTPVWYDDKRYILTLLHDHPESYRAHLVAGRVLAAMRNWDGAGREYAIARHLFPRDPSAFYEGAAVAAQAADLPRADALLDSAAATAPRSVAVHLAQADVRMRRRDFPGAIAAARRALVIAPDSARATRIIHLAAGSLHDSASGNRR
ncbi:MAG: glycosyltransferase family 39 protein [Gemmatimonadota bacterium]|nr:glycosyltransferase family 39 protein [Gemmatimonadota bacterium]